MIGPATTSDEQSATASITVRSSFLHGLDLNPPTVGFATLKIYDSEDSVVTGRKLIAEAVCAAGQNSVYISFNAPRVANRGIRAVLTQTTGTTAVYNVAFSLG